VPGCSRRRDVATTREEEALDYRVFTCSPDARALRATAGRTVAGTRRPWSSHAVPADPEPVITHVAGHVARITLSRPASLNAIDPRLAAALDAAMERVRDDPAIRVAILTGAGDRAFCSGADLKWRASHEGETRTPGTAGNRPGFIYPGFRCWKPVVAAVNGYAVGGGFELALACDIIVAADHARFGFPEPRRGLMADGGGVQRLVRRLPWSLAAGLLLTGRLIDAHEAFRMGFVNEVVPGDALMGAAERWAAEILECSPLAVQAAKEAATLGLEMDLSDAMATEFPAFRRLRASNDFVEGPRAFAERRRPVWEDGQP